MTDQVISDDETGRKGSCAERVARDGGEVVSKKHVFGHVICGLRISDGDDAKAMRRVLESARQTDRVAEWLSELTYYENKAADEHWRGWEEYHRKPVDPSAALTDTARG